LIAVNGRFFVFVECDRERCRIASLIDEIVADASEEPLRIEPLWVFRRFSGDLEFTAEVFAVNRDPESKLYALSDFIDELY